MCFDLLLAQHSTPGFRFLRYPVAQKTDNVFTQENPSFADLGSRQLSFAR
jgi:hypothetical protein